MKYPIKVLNFKRYCMMNRLHLIALIYATVSKRVPIIGTFFVVLGSHWVSIYISGSLFSFFRFIYAKNVNSVCMYTTMSYLDLSVMNNDLQKKMTCKKSIQSIIQNIIFQKNSIQKIFKT